MNRHLSIDEKRDWLACIFRDESGAYSQADKFKAMIEDTRLATLQQEQEKPAKGPAKPANPFTEELIAALPPPLDYSLLPH